ncbi:hypothetical protein [Vibrio parahaemolyticus]|uniref:hypothetical protein n=1 Tax=Vibrio parahaemolyticus TaxID=670 RepID=UPI0007B6D5B9|nr:hypothetical protein [Vibrio parahaemolyticus]ANB97450.1 hypothetical protein FORC14_1191 [Vibrio parahaemolyticus]
MSELLEGVVFGIFQHFSGINRDVCIDFDNGVGYKIFKKDSSWGGDEADFRINDIYKNIGFYEGKYSKYANNSKIEIIDDRKTDGRVVDVFRFELMPGLKLSLWKKNSQLYTLHDGKVWLYAI